MTSQNKSRDLKEELKEYKEDIEQLTSLLRDSPGLEAEQAELATCLFLRNNLEEKIEEKEKYATYLWPLPKYEDCVKEDDDDALAIIAMSMSVGSDETHCLQSFEEQKEEEDGYKSLTCFTAVYRHIECVRDLTGGSGPVVVPRLQRFKPSKSGSAKEKKRRSLGQKEQQITDEERQARSDRASKLAADEAVKRGGTAGEKYYYLLESNPSDLVPEIECDKCDFGCRCDTEWTNPDRITMSQLATFAGDTVTINVNTMEITSMLLGWLLRNFVENMRRSGWKLLDKNNQPTDCQIKSNEGKELKERGFLKFRHPILRKGDTKAKYKKHGKNEGSWERAVKDDELEFDRIGDREVHTEYRNKEGKVTKRTYVCICTTCNTAAQSNHYDCCKTHAIVFKQRYDKSSTEDAKPAAKPVAKHAKRAKRSK